MRGMFTRALCAAALLACSVGCDDDDDGTVSGDAGSGTPEDAAGAKDFQFEPDEEIPSDTGAAPDVHADSAADEIGRASCRERV